MTSKAPEVAYNQQAIQTHLGILQNTIERMAGNSAAAKAWCITLVSAILVIVADKHQPRFVWLALLPTLLFFGLDSYYLALERGFRRSYARFVERLHRGSLEEDDLYTVVHTGRLGGLLMSAVRSLSVWPFYGTLILMIYLAQKLVI
jgi:hypothetical protein